MNELKTVAIVGAHPKTRDLVPWDDPRVDKWLFNEWANADWCQEWDAVIQLHKPRIYRDLENKNDPAHWIWLQQEHDKPIYMQSVDPDVPDSVEYPLKAINRRFMSNLTYNGAEVMNYQSTAAYAIALALHLNYERIQVYGIEMEHSSEYRSQQPNFAFWLGVASQHAVVDMHCSQGLIDAELYGYEVGTENEKVHKYLYGMREQMAELERKQLILKGAMQLAEQLLENSN